MGNIPLHPLLVHFPVVLAALLPLVLIGLWWAERGGKVVRSAWWVAVAVAGLLMSSSLVALKTGQNEEGRVEDVVPRVALETHEERAETFLWATGGVLILAVVTGLVRLGATRTVLASATLLGSLTVAGLAVAVGHSGGKLVYQYDAAQAYAAGGARMGGDLDASRGAKHESEKDER